MNGDITPVLLARQSLTYYLETNKVMPVPDNLPEYLNEKAGVFVSLKKNGQLRGCIGTFVPTKKNMAVEIIYNAISAGTEDPRFWPVELDEVSDVEFSVDILSAPERVDGLEDLNPKKYGVIVKCGQRSGLLLPDLEGIDTASEQVHIAMQKAGIHNDETIDLYRFTVTRYK